MHVKQENILDDAVYLQLIDEIRMIATYNDVDGIRHHALTRIKDKINDFKCPLPRIRKYTNRRT